LFNRPLRDRPADRLGALQVAAGDPFGERSFDLRIDARSGDERLAAQVVDDLRVDMRDAPEHCQPRSLARALNPLSLTQLNPAAPIVFGLDFHLAPVFPAFFFST